MCTTVNFMTVNLPSMLAGVNIGLMEISGSPKRAYHHGDLRNALITAAAELAAQGGPGSVSIRAAGRLGGVAPAAAERRVARQAGGAGCGELGGALGGGRAAPGRRGPGFPGARRSGWRPPPTARWTSCPRRC